MNHKCELCTNEAKYCSYAFGEKIYACQAHYNHFAEQDEWFEI